MIFKLTWRNLWRNRRRTLITLSSVTFAMFLAIVMQSFQKGTFDNLIKNVVSFHYGYIQMHKKGYWDERIIDNGFIQDSLLLTRFNQQAHVTGVVPRLETFILASVGNTTKGCMLIGTDPRSENELSGLKAKVISGLYLETDDRAALIAEGLAQRLHLKVQDTVILLGQGYQGTLAAGKFPVKGIVRFGSPELNNQVLYLPLPLARELLNANLLLTSVSLSIDAPENMEDIQKNMLTLAGKEFEIMNWKELMPEVAGHIKADSASLYIFSGVLYLIIAFGIFGTILMMTAERKYEFGMLIAIGMKKVKLGITLLLESTWITILGLVLGLAISIPVIFYFKYNPIRAGGELASAYEKFGFEAVFPTAVHLPILFNQALTVLLIAGLVGLYPVWHILKLNPVMAMKK